MLPAGRLTLLIIFFEGHTQLPAVIWRADRLEFLAGQHRARLGGKRRTSQPALQGRGQGLAHLSLPSRPHHPAGH
jgi:hypothetical protein